jgi:hypothetical protein
LSVSAFARCSDIWRASGFGGWGGLDTTMRRNIP